jgi:hypothetical protein
MVDYGNVSKTVLQIIRVIQLGIGWQWYIRVTLINRYYEQLRVNGKINKIESGLGFKSRR